MELFRKAMITIGIGLALLQLCIVALMHLSSVGETKSFTQSDERVISMEGRQLSYQPLLIAPYKTADIFLSDEQKTDFNFTSVGLSWEQNVPEGTGVEAQMRLKSGGEWSEWLDLEEEQDPVDPGRTYAMISGNPSEVMQYKFIMYGDGSSTPVIQNTDWTFIKAGKTVSSTPAPSPKYSSLPALSDATYLALSSSTTTTVVSRSAWGADESLRYLDDGAELDLIDRDEEFYEKYKDELQYSRVVESDQSGGRYIWPLQYPESVEKIIIHHTATTSNLDNPTQAIRDIYHYHAATRGWGDIGYNYIVDKDGKIYEGRYGGESVIGAHSGPGNHGSIGIAVLGNYEDNPIAEKAVVGLSRFISKKAKIHEIEPNGSSDFRGKVRPNVFAHRDIMDTTCPGQQLYDKIPLIRLLADYSFEEKEKFVKDYDYQDRSELYYLELKPKQETQVTIKMENIGKVAWDDGTYLIVTQNDAFEDTISFPEKDGAKLAIIEEGNVAPGEIATFNFKILSGNNGATVHMSLAPVVNGTKKIDDYIQLPVTIIQPIYKYEIVETDYPPQSVKKGEQYKASVTLKNTGNVDWMQASLGNSKPVSDVAPGENATFDFTFTAGNERGDHYESMQLMVDGGNFNTSPDIGFNTFIYKDDYDGEVTSKPLSNKWVPGESYTVKIKLLNTGNQGWQTKNLKGTFLKDGDIGISGLSLSPKTVAIGQTGTISFKVKVDENAELTTGKYLIFTPKVGDNRLDKSITLKYSINEPEAVIDTPGDGDDNKIRIKLGFEGEPEITADGDFDLYNGDTYVESFGEGEKFAVSESELTGSETMRFVPQNDSILEIANFEHRPSWNQKLNDNRYRGVLEVRMVDDELVVINELDMEDYLKGLGEVSNTEHPEKIKTIIVAARSYAKFYTDIAEKFPGKPYHLDDNPDVSQKYLGYGFEQRAPKIAEAVKATEGEVIGYGGSIVKAPYFNQSDGTKTKSAKEVWGWNDTPYLVSVDDSLCAGDEFLGHGVGLSGCGAKAMAEDGYDYKEILKHYYTDIEILDLY